VSGWSVSTPASSIRSAPSYWTAALLCGDPFPPMKRFILSPVAAKNQRHENHMKQAFSHSQCRDGPKCQIFAGFPGFPAYLWRSGTYRYLMRLVSRLFRGGNLKGWTVDGWLGAKGADCPRFVRPGQNFFAKKPLQSSRASQRMIGSDRVCSPKSWLRTGFPVPSGDTIVVACLQSQAIGFRDLRPLV